jgi:Xaa-Pro dipeptidase
MNQEKVNELTRWMVKENVDVAYITNPNSISYLSGFTSDPHERVLALFFSPTHDPFLFTPALEADTARQSSWPYDVVGYLDTQNPWQIIAEELTTRYGKPQQLAIEKSAFTLDKCNCTKLLQKLKLYLKQVIGQMSRLKLVFQQLKMVQQKKKLLQKLNTN